MPIFDQVFAPMGPGYLASEVAPLVAFSVAITLSNNFSGNIRAKIDWIDRALQCIDIRVSKVLLFAVLVAEDNLANGFGISHRIRKLLLLQIKPHKY